MKLKTNNSSGRFVLEPLTTQNGQNLHKTSGERRKIDHRLKSAAQHLGHQILFSAVFDFHWHEQHASKKQKKTESFTQIFMSLPHAKLTNHRDGIRRSLNSSIFNVCLTVFELVPYTSSWYAWFDSSAFRPIRRSIRVIPTVNERLVRQKVPYGLWKCVFFVSFLMQANISTLFGNFNNEKNKPSLHILSPQGPSLHTIFMAWKWRSASFNRRGNTITTMEQSFPFRWYVRAVVSVKFCFPSSLPHASS